MRFATPAGLAAALLALPLVAWYVLRVRRPRVAVASTYLWRRTERSVAAAVPWQRFRGDLTFWLVLLAILAGSVALARPYVTVTAELGDHTILIVDASASMLAVEDGPTRLELARREATALVDRLGPGQAMSVIEAAGRARVLLSTSTDPAAVRRALSAIRPSHAPADLEGAFTLAAALERPGQLTVVHLLTDGAVPDRAAAVAPGGLLVTSVASERPNLAVTRLQAVPLGAGSSQVFAQVRNYGLLPTSARLTLSVDGEEVVVQDLRLAPRGTEDVVLAVTGGGDVLRAEVRTTGLGPAGQPIGDALGADDAAYAILSSPREVTVLVVGPGNLFLEAALASVPGVTVRSAASVPDDLVGIDLLVADRVPLPDVPAVPVLLVAPDPPPHGVELTGVVDLPALSYQLPAHELLADVDLSEVAIAEAQRVVAPALVAIAGGSAGPLILAGRLDGTPTVYLTFDVLVSNLPLQVSWPVFVANAVSWLAGPPTSTPVPAGTTVTVPVVTDATTVTVVPPSGAPQRLDPAAPRVLADEVGVWRVRYETPSGTVDGRPFAVNPAPGEGDLGRAQPDPIEARDAADARRVAGASEGRRVFGRQLLAAVLALAVGEWAWAHWLRPLRARRRCHLEPRSVASRRLRRLLSRGGVG